MAKRKNQKQTNKSKVKVKRKNKVADEMIEKLKDEAAKEAQAENNAVNNEADKEAQTENNAVNNEADKEADKEAQTENNAVNNEADKEAQTESNGADKEADKEAQTESNEADKEAQTESNGADKEADKEAQTESNGADKEADKEAQTESNEVSEYIGDGDDDSENQETSDVDIEKFNMFLDSIEGYANLIGQFKDTDPKLSINMISKFVEKSYKCDCESISRLLKSIDVNTLSKDDILLKLTSDFDLFEVDTKLISMSFNFSTKQIKEINKSLISYQSGTSELYSEIKPYLENDDINSIDKIRVNTFFECHIFLASLYQKYLLDILKANKVNGVKIYESLDSYKESAIKLFGNKFDVEKFDNIVSNMKKIISEDISIEKLKTSLFEKVAITNTWTMKYFLNRLVTTAIFKEDVIKKNKKSETILKYASKIENIDLSNITRIDLLKIEKLLLEDLDK